MTITDDDGLYKDLEVLGDEKLINYIKEYLNRYLDEKCDWEEEEYDDDELDESSLYEAIEGSVRKALNEISSETLRSAYNKAEQQGRMKQGANLYKGFVDRSKKELNVKEGDFRYYSDRAIVYNNGTSRPWKVTVYHTGVVRVNDATQSRNIYENDMRQYMAVEDPRMARAIAKWVSRYVDKQITEKYPNLTDWHYYYR